MKRTWKNFKLDPNKVYKSIGQAVVYGSLYIGSIVFGYWGFLQRNDLLRREKMVQITIIDNQTNIKTNDLDINILGTFELKKKGTEVPIINVIADKQKLFEQSQWVTMNV